MKHWGGGMIVSVDGLRFVVPVKSPWAGPNPRYSGLRHRGATWLNGVSNSRIGRTAGAVSWAPAMPLPSS
ncbi:MAG: Tn3 family transposase [Solirubrobacteraceae bacterium]